MKKKLQIISFLIIFFFIVSSEETINDSTDPNPKDIEPIETLEKTDEPSETDDIASDIEETQMNYSEYDVMSDAIPHEDEHEDDEDEDEEIYNTSYPTNDEGEQSITNKPGPSDEFIMEWEKVMGNFVPEDITTFKIEAGGTEYFIEDAEINSSNTEVMIKGAFFLHVYNFNGFGVQAKNPNGEVVLNYFNKKEGVFNLNCTMSGKYIFEFNNPSSDDIKITVAAHYFHEEKNVVKREEINVLHEKMKNSLRIIKGMITENKFGEIHRGSYLEVLSKGYKRLFYFTFLESAVILIVTVVQIHFIEKLLSNKVSV